MAAGSAPEYESMRTRAGHVVCMVFTTVIRKGVRDMRACEKHTEQAFYSAQAQASCSCDYRKIVTPRPTSHLCCHPYLPAVAVGSNARCLWRHCRRTPLRNRPYTMIASRRSVARTSGTHNLPIAIQACVQFVMREFGRRKGGSFGVYGTGVVRRQRHRLL